MNAFRIRAFAATLFALSVVLGAFSPVADAATLAQQLSGRILLQVEESGQAWYVNPKDLKRYYMGRPTDAYNLMRQSGVGITNGNLFKIPLADANLTTSFDLDGDGLSDSIEVSMNTNTNSRDTDGDGYEDKQEILGGYEPWSTKRMSLDTTFARANAGKIFLQVESRGEAWYINPVDFKRYYLGRPIDAFNVMRALGLGISNSNLATISVGGTSSPVNPPALGPDLVIRSITANNLNPRPGETVTFTVHESNTGGFAGSHSSRIRGPQSNVISIASIPGLSTNQDTYFTGQWTCPSAGTYTFAGEADYFNVIAEVHETNNDEFINIVCGGDTTAPIILNVTPSNGTTNVSQNAQISVQFSEPMNPVTLDGSSFRMLNSNNVQVGGSLTYSGTTAVFTPSVTLAADTLYTVTVTNAVRDAANNNMVNNYSWTFRTGGGNSSAPVVSSVNPANGATGAPTFAPLITVTFNEDMDVNSVNSSTFKLFAPGNIPVQGSVSRSGLRTFYLSPGTTLAGNTQYVVWVSNNVWDTSGTPMTNQFTSSFTTASTSQTTWAVRLYNIDDSSSFAVNSGTPVVASYGQDSGLVDITNSVNASSTNRLDLKASNGNGGYTWGFEVRRNGTIIFNESAGQVGVTGANNNDQSKPNQFVYNKTLNFNDSGIISVVNNLP